MPGDASNRRTRRPFIGRRHELTPLQGGINSLLAARGSMFLLTGEPGIGKTRLADEFSALATQQGVRVFWGRCWEGGGAPAFWPWAQVLRALLASDLCNPTASDLQYSAEVEMLSGEIVQVVPEVQAPGVSPAPVIALPADPEQARFRLFDAITRLLKRIAARAPLALVLDDLHDGDLASLLLLRFLAREIRESAICLVATYRDVEARRSPTLGPVFAQLVREGESLHLAGLSPAEVENLIDSTLRVELPRSVKLEVHRATEGNPFYVDEVARVLAARAVSSGGSAADGSAIQIPDTVRAAIRERLKPLSKEAHAVLRTAAVLGRDFDIAPIAPMLAESGSVTAIAEAIEEAVQLGVLRKKASTGRYSFAHVLIRDTIHEDLPAAQRSAMHRQVGEELERRVAAGFAVDAAQLAHHFLQAPPGDCAAKAIHHVIGAGDEALRRLAYEEAVRHYLDAQGLLERRPADPHRLADLLLKLGDAQRWGSDLSTSRSTFHRAATIARALLDVEPRTAAVSLLARAALGYARVSETGSVDYGLVALLEETLTVLGSEDSVWRSRILARLAVGLYFSPDRQRREAYSKESIAIAERLGDRAATVNALVAQHFTIWGPDSLRERLQVASKVVRLSEELGERETELEARSWRFTDLLESGDVEGAAVEHRRFVELAEHHRFPVYLWQARMHQSMYATLEGRFAQAESLAQEAADIGGRFALTNTRVFFMSQMLALRILQERSSELEAQVREVAERMPSMPIWKIGHVITLIHQGRKDTARDKLGFLCAQGCAAVLRDGMWISCMNLLAYACLLLEDRQQAQVIYRLLQPYADRICVSGAGISCAGAASLALGRLALLLGTNGTAIVHLQEALDVMQRLRARPYIAQVRYGLALALPPSDPAALEHCKQAEAIARDLGLPSLESQARRLRTELQSPTAVQGMGMPTPPTDLPVPAVLAQTQNVFRREGEFWSLHFAGSVVRLKDSKGLRYMHRLLAHPGVEIHALDLATFETATIPAPQRIESTDTTVTLRGDLGDCGEVLDAKAITAYKHRLRDLREELQEAGANNDLGRKQRLQQEMDSLAQQLAAATGLGGRTRRTGGHGEQARINVTKAIASAIKKMRGDHPALAQFLANSVKTGAFCVYNPDPVYSVLWIL